MYSIESIHLLPHVLHTHLLASEFLVCTLQRATVSSNSAHKIGIARVTTYWSVITTCNQCYIPNNLFQPIHMFIQTTQRKKEILPNFS